MARHEILRRNCALVLIAWAFVVYSAGAAWAQEEKKEEAPPAQAAPALPPYFTGTSPDPEKPLWPDPTGANAGYWATPAASPTERRVRA